MGRRGGALKRWQRRWKDGWVGDLDAPGARRNAAIDMLVFDHGLLRKACIYMGVCATFGTGAASGALLTEHFPKVTLIVPVIALLLVVLLCRAWRPADVAQQAE